MNFKIVSSNNELKQKAIHIFTILNMKEAIHIQDVDFWLIDVKTIDKEAIESYKNRQASAFLLFVVNDDEDIETILKNNFPNYINASFSNKELKSWYRFYKNTKKIRFISLNENTSINLDKNELILNDKIYVLTKQEIALLKALISGDFISTKLLKSILKLNSETSVRTIISRLRKKIDCDIFIQKRNYGYRLDIASFKVESKVSNLYIKELEEQNALIQKIVDSSSVNIVTLIHKQLFCVNKSFRDLLGNDIIKELWDETKGDFFQLIKHNSIDKSELKKELFDTKTTSEVEIYNFKTNGYHKFKVQTYFFEKLDKHLMIFS
ncbi:hypothetical protein CPG38_13600 [Malaciobacter marinus]|uniref:hypothetical protein n=1 Tax=Malaciobacter marinus TaxID=505249 RepID=UPI000C06B679|nr:hypothetical protein [Malaciobacter marinus]PHO11341.1 hypothetical protein CPG38_13600 [Malaciobacter marinus]